MTQTEIFLFPMTGINKMFSEENKVPRTLFGARKERNNVKQYEIELSFEKCISQNYMVLLKEDATS